MNGDPTTEKLPVELQLTRFVAEASKSRFTYAQWLVDDEMEVYVRKSFRLLPVDYDERRLSTCLDIASIEVYRQNRGTFSKFLVQAHEANPWDATFIENVMSERLSNSLLRKGWEPLPGIEGPTSYFMRTK